MPFIPFAWSLAVAIAYFMAIAPSSILPQRHSEWFPYVTLGFGLVGSLRSLDKRRPKTGDIIDVAGVDCAKKPRTGTTPTEPPAQATANEDVLDVGTRLYVLIAVVASLTLVPRWPDLQPPRSTQLVGLSLYLAGVSFLFIRLSRSTGPHLLALSLLLISSLIAALIGWHVSVKLALNMVLISTACGVVLVGTYLPSFRKGNQHRLWESLVATMSAVSAVGAYLGVVEVRSPPWVWLVIPVTPAVLVIGPRIIAAIR